MFFHSDRQRLTMADIIDEQRNQFLRELIGAVVVRTVGDDDGHAIGIMEGTHEVIGRSLGRTVRRVRIVLRGLQEELVTISQMMLCRRGCGGERRFNTLGMRQFECAIDLIGRDVVEAARDIDH